jgi:hypothetical protein
LPRLIEGKTSVSRRKNDTVPANYDTLSPIALHLSIHKKFACEFPSKKDAKRKESARWNERPPRARSWIAIWNLQRRQNEGGALGSALVLSGKTNRNKKNK